MSTANLSSDCAILAVWQPTIYANGCCNTSSSTCNSAGNVVGVDLSANQLTGIIPTELARLTSLTALDLYNNQLTGPIPTELGRLTSLKSLLLDSNRLSGSIPCEFSNLKALSIRKSP
ncbi:hypothetical protein BJ741DRAFT_88312 [Chytriomyces cf. hyalinus JEL632]|nr:hypothetical protein BJ741DRAFT_88312 [Chytriomyces cf. hyalinus JEL632]